METEEDEAARYVIYSAAIDYKLTPDIQVTRRARST